MARRGAARRAHAGAHASATHAPRTATPAALRRARGGPSKLLLLALLLALAVAPNEATLLADLAGSSYVPTGAARRAAPRRSSSSRFSHTQYLHVAAAPPAPLARARTRRRRPALAPRRRRAAPWAHCWPPCGFGARVAPRWRARRPSSSIIRMMRMREKR
jgi:hypothetical protein